MMRISGILLLSTLFSIQVSSKDLCRALAMSGGGDKGAYEAGAVYGLVNGLPAD
jgi:hypothetical protein